MAVATLPSCEFCGLEVDIRKKGFWTRVTGWVEQRGGKGGSNNVVLRGPTQAVAHDACIQDQKLGYNPDQEQLFNPGPRLTNSRARVPRRR